MGFEGLRPIRQCAWPQPRMMQCQSRAALLKPSPVVCRATPEDNSAQENASAPKKASPSNDAAAAFAAKMQAAASYRQQQALRKVRCCL
jgi:hypothetical protein